MGAIKAHKTAVDKTGAWDGPKAVADAPNDAAVLRYMSAWVDDKGDPTKKSSYKFPHHEPGTDTPAVIAGVNNALARLPQANIPGADRAGVEAHLRKHRVDAGLEEAMSEAEIAETVKYIKKVDDLKAGEAKALSEGIHAQEQANLGNWIEARIHTAFTEVADDLFGNGLMTREERIAFSSAISDALNAFNASVQKNIPQVYQREPFQGPDGSGAGMMGEADNAGKAGNADIQAAIQWLQKAIQLHQDHMDGKAPTTGAEGEKSQKKMMGQMMNALKALGGDMGTMGEASDFEIAGDYVPLLEGAVRSDGTIPIKIIQPGWGSSGYYPAEVLQRDGPKVFTKDTKMYWNHATPQEEAQRPEGDLNNLAAVLTSDARWMDNGPKGAGLYADAKVFDGYQKPVDEMAKHIGVSIRAMGQAKEGSADGRNGPIIQALTARKSVDFVTEPGAGGEIITMFEAVRKPLTVGGQQLTGTVKSDAGTVPASEATTSVASSNMDMEEEMEIKELQEKVATLETSNETLATNNARLSESLALRDAKDMVSEALASLSNMPDVTKRRLTNSLAKNPPMKDGALDKEVFGQTIAEALKAEVKYLEEVAGLGQIRGLGPDGDDDEAEDDKADEELEDSFRRMGLSESAAKIAAKGRG